jgi:hypothetical protein
VTFLSDNFAWDDHIPICELKLVTNDGEATQDGRTSNPNICLSPLYLPGRAKTS